MQKPLKYLLRGDSLFTVRELYGADECAELVALAHRVGFDAAPISVGGGFAMRPDIRNNTRAMVDDHERARRMWDRLAPFVPARRGEWRAVGLNERFRFYRYEPGQYFRWHRDGPFVRRDGEASLLTVMLYLDEAVEGGATAFKVEQGILRVIPACGTVLVFDHPLLHQGEPVVAGVKHVLRTDVMYRRA